MAGSMAKRKKTLRSGNCFVRRLRYWWSAVSPTYVGIVLWLKWLLPICRTPRFLYGSVDLNGSMLTLFSLALATAGSFAITVDQVSSVFAQAATAYVLLTAVILLLTGQLALAPTRDMLSPRVDVARVGIIHGQSPTPSHAGPTLALPFTRTLPISRWRLRVLWPLKADRTSVAMGWLTSWTAIFLCATFVTMGHFEWFPNQNPRRSDYQDPGISFNVELATDPPKLVPTTSAIPAAHQENIAEAYKEWLALFDVVDGKSSQVLIATQSVEFKDDFRSFAAVMNFRQQKGSNVEFESAWVMLVPGETETESRYFELLARLFEKDEVSKRNQTLARPKLNGAKELPVFVIPTPSRGDRLVIFARVKPRVGDTLPAIVSDFHFQVRKVPWSDLP